MCATKLHHDKIKAHKDVATKLHMTKHYDPHKHAQAANGTHLQHPKQRKEGIRQ